MLLALGAPPGNSLIPMGGGSEWPQAPRLELEEPRPELPTAAARVRKPVGRPQLSRATLGGSPALAASSRWQSSAAPPACRRRRPSTRDRGRPSSRERARQCAPEPPESEVVAAPVRVDQAGARVPIPATWCVPASGWSSATLGRGTCHSSGFLVLTHESRFFTPNPHTPPQRAALLRKQKPN